ncbi:TPA: tape measure protein [Escherichia coli]
MSVKEVGRFVNTIHWQSDNSWQKELQRIKKYKKTVESAHEQIAKTQYRASAGMIKAQQAQARAQEKIRKAALAAQMRSQKQLQTLEKRMAREQARHNKLMSGVVSGRSMAKQRTITTMSGMKNMFSTATLNKYRASLQRLNAQYASGGMSVSMYNQKLAALRNEMRATEASARRLGATIKGAFKEFKGAGSKLSAGVDRAFNAAMMGTTAAGGLTKVAMDNSANRNSAYYGLMAMNNDSKAATDDQMKFIRNVSNAHGMDQKTAETGFLQWAASTKNMTENDRRALFEAMAIKGRSTGATGEQLHRAQVALSQMSGKGQVMQEELKGQLSEALPGSQADFQQAYAKSIGKETVSLEEFNKAMKDGDVQLQKILPHLVEIWNSAKNTRAYAEAMKQPEMAMQRLKNAAYDASIAMFGQIDATDGVYTLAELIDDTAQHLTATLEENKGEIEAVGAGIAAFFARIQYGLGWFYEACKPILEFFGVDTKNAKEVGDFLGKAVLIFGALKAIKSVVGLFAPLISGLWKLGGALRMLLGIARSRLPSLGGGKLPSATSTAKTATSTAKNAKTAVNAARGARVGAGVAAGAGSVAVPLIATELASEAITGEGILNDTFGDTDYYQRLRSATTFGDFFKALVGKDADKAGWKVNENGEKVWHDERQGTNLWDNFTGMIKEWAQPAEMYRPSVTANTSQALPAPSTGFNGAVPSQVMVESSGDINAQFQVTVDENGLLRVVQKEVETAIGWEKTKEINMFAIGG